MKNLHKVGLIALVALMTTPSIADNHSSDVQVIELATGLDHPWGMAFMPNGNIIITERKGHMRMYSFAKGLSERFSGLPAIVSPNQGGLLDVVLDPDFNTTNTLYFCYTRPDGNANSSAVAKAELQGTRLVNVKDIFITDTKVNNGFHFGCRLVFDENNHLFVSLGDRGDLKAEAQETDNHSGKIVRIDRDGNAIASNPFIDGKAPQIFTYGHRNVQGMTLHPTTGELWAMEHGPKGGDEVNLIEKGKNYGWPTITYGVNYDDSIITDKTAMAGMEQPVIQWTPSIAPSGMAFYQGEVFKDWQGDLLVGALKFRHLRRIEMKDGKPGKQHEYLKDRNERIRDVEVAPNGLIYLLTDDSNGKLLQLTPK